jgi:hypothetical protein
VNQSAVSGLPAALNQATSALLRLIVAAGGAKRSPMHTATAAAAHSMATEQLQADEYWRFADGADAEAASGAKPSSSSSSSRGGSRPGSIPRRFAAAALGDSQPRYAAASSRKVVAKPHSTLASHADADAGAGATGSDMRCNDAGRTVAGGARGRGRLTDFPGGGHLPSCTPVITAVSSPLPLMLGEKAQRVRQDAGALMLVLCMTLAASVLSASFVVFLVRWAHGL